MTTQYNIVSYGTLTNTNGVLSNFSTSNYATLPHKFAPSGDSFEIVIRFRVDSIDTSQNTYPTLLASIDTSTLYSGYNLQVYEGALYFEVVQNDEPVVVVQDNTKVLSANTDYYAKVTFNGSAYTTYISTDGTTWVQQASTTSSIYYPSTNINLTLLGKQYSADINNVLNGSIDLNESYIDINNIRWWQGVTSVSNVQTRIQLRHDTVANWTSVNPILLEGEVGIETDTLKQKVGDGVTAWNSLSYMGSNEIFVAEYNVTPFADIKTAYDAGKTILCKGNDYQSNAIGVMYKYNYALAQGGIGNCTFYSMLDTVAFMAKVSLASGTTTWETTFSEFSKYDLSNVTSIDANSAVQTALDAKVNKSGDTMTGGLTVQNNHIIIESPDAWDSTPSEQIETGIEFNNNNNDRLGYVNCVYATNGARLARLNTRNADGSANTYIEVGYNPSGNAYCTFPNTTCVDGQWVSSYQEAIGTTAQTINAQTSKSITFTNLPAKNCEILFTISQSTSYDLGIYSDLIGSTTNRALNKGCISMILPVSSNKTIKVQNLGSGAASITAVRMYGYRVLGTNTNA